jgi:micrococcal nuclease
MIALLDGRCLNHEIVRAGLAWWFRRYAPNDEVLRKLEDEARRGRRGVWIDLRPIPPWDFRKNSRYQNRTWAPGGRDVTPDLSDLL